MFDKQSLITQANKLIMAPQKFSFDEKRFLLCLISKISPGDKDFKKHRIKFDEYANFIGQDYDYVKNNLPKITRRIMREILEIQDGKTLRQRSVIIGTDHEFGYGYVDVQIHPDLKDALLDLQGYFTSYKLENVLRMNSKHAIRLYEIIKCEAYKKQRRFTLSWTFIPNPLKDDYKEPEIQKLLGTNYKRFIDFERKVLKPAQEEMKKHSDVYFTYTKDKVGRFLCAINFEIQDNVPTKDHNQMSLFDIMPMSDKFIYKTPKEMAIEAEKAIDNMDRDKLCREFQKAVKREYGFDFNLGLLEGISNQRIAEVLPVVGNLGIKQRDQASSVIKYISKKLRGEK